MGARARRAVTATATSPSLAFSARGGAAVPHGARLRGRVGERDRAAREAAVVLPRGGPERGAPHAAESLRGARCGLHASLSLALRFSLVEQPGVLSEIVMKHHTSLPCPRQRRDLRVARAALPGGACVGHPNRLSPRHSRDERRRRARPHHTTTARDTPFTPTPRRAAHHLPPAPLL